MVSTLKIYEILEQAKIADKQARVITMAIERAIQKDNAEQANALASKADFSVLEGVALRLEAKIVEAKTEMIRWMFIFWLGQFPVIAGLFKLMK